MRDIYNIVKEEIFNEMNLTIRVESSVDNVLTICGSLKWLRTGLTLTDSNDVVFTVVSVNVDANTVTVSHPTITWTTRTGTIQAFKFFIGTPMQTNTEWSMFSTDERTKLPCIWMVEPTQERLKQQWESLERDSDIRIVFLDSNNSKDWITTDVHTNRLQAIYNGVEEFIKAIENNGLFGDITSEKQVKNFTRFGTETTDGFEKNIIDADLTGVELRLTLPIHKQPCNC